MLRSVFAPYGKIPGSWPYGITQSRGPNGTYLQPHDPQYHTHDQAGYFYDTQLGRPLTLRERWRAMRALRKAKRLGAIPTDFEMASLYNYTPVASGWIATEQGYLTPPWLPPNNAPQGGYPVPVQPNDGGGSPEPSTALRFYTPRLANDPNWNTTTLGEPATVEEVLAQQNAHNDRVFALALVSTTAVAVSAIITVFRTLRLIRKD